MKWSIATISVLSSSLVEFSSMEKIEVEEPVLPLGRKLITSWLSK
jgi:hypothetical protein